MADIRIGIGGWSYAPWRGTFFPKGLAQSKELEFASRQFGAIEINGTFYSRQKRETWEKWGATASDGFQFALKASRFCVGRRTLADGEESISNFLAQGIDALGAKLGPILWQFSNRRQFDHDDIAAFVALLPERLGGIVLRHAIEPRHESFRDERFFALCQARNIAVVEDDSDDYPAISADTASFRYARLQRMRGDCPTGYDEKALEAFADRARRWQADGRDSYIFMINGAKERAPAAALALQERLG
jgi:uncharacterized protein YecE (DUF72 family)